MSKLVTGKTNFHSLRFVPKEEGVHHLHSKFNGVHIPGSPFKIVVGSINSNNDPSTVGVFGRGKRIRYACI